MCFNNYKKFPTHTYKKDLTIKNYKKMQHSPIYIKYLVPAAFQDT